MSTITYRFSPVPFDLKKKMKEELKGNQYKVMDAVAEEVCLYPENRDSFTKELSCRFLEKIVNIRYDHVAKTLKKLEKRGFIKILELGKEKGEGSIIQILVQDSGTPEKPSPKTGTNPEKSVPVSGEKAVELVPKTGTKQENPIQENKQKTTPNPKVESVSLSKNKKEISLVKTILPETSQPEVKNINVTFQDIPCPKFTIPDGISPATLNTGIEKLRLRGIEDIDDTMAAIFAYMKNMKTIKKPSGYFLSLCDKMEIAPQAEPVMERAPQKKVVDPATAKREADMRQAVEEKRITGKFIQFMEINFPDVLEQYIATATQDWKRETKGFMGKKPFPGYIEAKIKVYAEVDGIWKGWLMSEGLNMN